MTTTKKNKETSKVQAPAKRMPIKVFRSKDRPHLSCSVWDRHVQYEGETISFYSISTQRSYERDGERFYTGSLDSEDIEEAVRLQMEAKEYIENLQDPDRMLPDHDQSQAE